MQEFLLTIIVILLLPDFVEKMKGHWRPVRNWWQRRAIHKASLGVLLIACLLHGQQLQSPVATANTIYSASGCYLISAASTNSTSCKGSAGNFYGVRMINTTATLYYLRMYNTASAPTCSSATGFIESIPVPASTTGAGLVSFIPVPISYSTGIGFCFTGGSSSTDNTNAATGVFGVVVYK